jgi:chromosome segregation ATPase
MFIEQKHGWSDILSGMPVFGIRESKKRVVEYVLGLDTLKNEKVRDYLNALKSQLEREWEQLTSDMQREVYSENCDIINLPPHPCVLTDKDYSRITISTSGGLPIADEVVRLQTEYTGLRQLKPRVIDNFEALNSELSETETAILKLESDFSLMVKKLTNGNEAINRLTSDLEIVNSDIRNNEDAARLQKFGSDAMGDELSVNVCPTCKQSIQDNLLTVGTDSGFMHIEDNIQHLKEQKKMLEFSINSRKNTHDELKREKQQIEINLQKLRQLAQTLRSDLYTTIDTEASEAIMLKRIEVSRQIARLSKLQITSAAMPDKLKELSSQWNSYLDQKGKLPRHALSDSDSEKIRYLKMRFINNLLNPYKKPANSLYYKELWQKQGNPLG